MNSKEQAERMVRPLILTSAYVPQRSSRAPAFSIAFSRDAGSRGAQVAQEVGKKLRWPVYDKELLDQLAKDLRVDVSHLHGVDERPGSAVVEFIESFAASLPVSESNYFRGLVKLITALGAKGEAIIVGRGAMIILPEASTLRVRVVATRADRIEAIRRARNTSEREAAHYLEQTDEERTSFIRSHFRKDSADPLLYDLVLNSSRLSIDECAEIVVAALHRLQARTQAD